MSLHFYPLVVKALQRETAAAVSIEFDIPASLQKEFAFVQGQNITIRTTLHGQEVRRNYSICSSPLENKLCVAVKKIEGGLFSTYANEVLKKGDVLDVMPPTGKFYTPLDPQQKKQYLALAAGSGITPVLSLIKTTLATEPHSHFTLVYGNRTRHSILFFEELENLKNRYLQRLTLIHILSREKTESVLHVGRIDSAKLAALAPLIPYAEMDEVFLCGPRAMIETSRDFLLAHGLGKKKIHLELFHAGIPGTPAASSSAIANTTVNSKVQLRIDGREILLEIPLQDNQTILDAALQQGADLPFACKGGMCCTCKAKLLEGEVSMDVHWGLEEEELEQGFILTCQSHPKTERIVVDFDAK
jgi:ring-1,2-phenylacetyl-CoA epoxidase subunit PaaE